ncbi:Muscarinic acetylcholine receptor M1 [Holothuria leucospilota]|uniref:Muscarinic acetylcholine receptor M1 n=1 Tax=Holothuria leucospilota TaxID=206669 RepID=A0A9Q1BM41_HOLLE|nr:Muscarinic acetylcholine receptor M1 [Holothuria leucospilota]
MFLCEEEVPCFLKFESFQVVLTHRAVITFGKSLKMASTDIPRNETTFPLGDEVPSNITVNVTRVTILSVIAFLVVISNLSIILAFAVEKQLRVYTNYYIINMAIADVMVGLTAMGLSILQNLLQYVWPFGYIACNVIISISHSSLHVSVLMLVVICIDRWYAVHYPLKHLAQRRKKNALRRNILVWLASFLFWGSFIGVWGLVDTTLHNTTLCGPLYNRYVISTLVAAAMYYWIPTIIIGILYYFIYRKIRSSGGIEVSKQFQGNGSIACHSSVTSIPGSETTISHVSKSVSYNSSAETLSHLDNPATVPEVTTESKILFTIQTKMRSSDHYNDDRNVHQGGTTSDARQTTKSKRNQETTLDNQKAQRTLSLLIISLVLTWTPYATAILASTYCHTVLMKRSGECFPTIFLVVGLWCSWGNSILNPFMYAAAQPLFRKTILKIYVGKWRK